MITERINGQDAEIHVFDREGRPVAEGLTPREVLALVLIDSALKAYRQFRTEHPGATLEQAHSMRGVDEHCEGRYYLRYRSAEGMIEFRGHTAERDAVNYRKATVSVALPDRRKQLELLKSATKAPASKKQNKKSAA